MVDRIPCTSVPATLLALAATAPTNVVQSACNKAEIMRLLDMRSIERLMDRRGAHPGSSQLRALLAVDDLGPGWTRSELEKRFLRLARETGLPAPTVNDSIAIPGEELQCDFVWHKQRVIVEVDGWETHRTRKAFHDDRRRDQLLQLVGWDVVRFTSDDLDRRPGQVVEVVSAMLERGLVARRPFAGSARDG